MLRYLSSSTRAQSDEVRVNPPWDVQVIELRRNPQGAINKRTRATLRPMLKIRRDSTVSELDERLKEAKLTNKKFRKQLLQKDSELQVSFPDRQTSKRPCISKYHFAGLLTGFLYGVARPASPDVLPERNLQTRFVNVIPIPRSVNIRMLA